MENRIGENCLFSFARSPSDLPRDILLPGRYLFPGAKLRTNGVCFFAAVPRRGHGILFAARNRRGDSYDVGLKRHINHAGNVARKKDNRGARTCYEHCSRGTTAAENNDGWPRKNWRGERGGKKNFAVRPFIAVLSRTKSVFFLPSRRKRPNVLQKTLLPRKRYRRRVPTRWENA